MPSAELLTTGQIAKELGVDRSTVHYWARDGKLTPAQVVNGIRLFNRADVDALRLARSEDGAA